MPTMCGAHGWVEGMVSGCGPGQIPFQTGFGPRGLRLDVASDLQANWSLLKSH